MSGRSSEQYQSKGKKKLNTYERAAAKYGAIHQAITGNLPDLGSAMEDDFNPNTGLSFVRRADGGYLGILKRDCDLNKQLIMAYGDDIIDAMMGLEKKLKSGKWQKDIPWDQKKLKKSGG